MFKKYFILVFIFASFVFLNNKASAAFFLDTGGVNTCTSKYINATATNVISAADLNGNIDICIIAGSNPPFRIDEIGSIFAGATSTPGISGTSTIISMPFTFATSSISKNEQINFSIYDASSSSLADSAVIDSIIPIVPIDLSNDQGLLENGTMYVGKSITFTCTNSTELYYDPVAGQTNTPIVSDYTGATNYNLVYTVTPTQGNHSVECDNIDGSLTRQVFNFSANSLINIININNTTYSPTVALSPVNFTWDSNGTNCSFYNYDKSIKFGDASGSANSGFSFDLTLANAPQTPNTYGYYIECYDSSTPDITIDTTNPNLSSSTEIINGVSRTVAWYSLMASFTCPTGYTSNNGSCVSSSVTPSCVFTDSSDQSISCSCPGGNITGLTVDNTDGTSQATTTTFAWSNLQYRYEVSCGGGNPILYSALERPYTHFLSFNVSAGYIKPGGAIDMNWVVQDPTSTCKIVGIDLKTGQEIFNSDSGDYPAIQKSVTVLKSSSSVRNFSAGSFENLMSKAFIVNNSARFTASCENNSTYMPGHYQLVRDVYTTTSQEQ